MTGRIVRVGVTQTEPAWLDLAAGVEKTCKLIQEAAKNKAELIAFPECWIPGYPCWIWSRSVDFDLNIKYIKNALAVDSPEMRTIQECARDNGVAVALGFSENDNNSLYIAQVLIGPDGAIKVHRRKMKPTHMERTVFGDASGHCLKSVAELPFGRVGQLSCWEHLQPLLKFNTIAQREDIHIAAWPVLEPHPGGPLAWSMSAEGCETFSRTHAVESSAFVLHCTTLITDKGVQALGTAGTPLMSKPGGGYAAVFGPDGRRLTEPLGGGPAEEGVLYADLDMDLIPQAKMFADVTGHYSRPDLMWLGVDSAVKEKVRDGGTSGKSGEENGLNGETRQ